VSLAGRVPAGRSCVSLNYGIGMNSNPDHPDITQTVQASATLTVGP
jgi:hypothetical protein